MAQAIHTLSRALRLEPDLAALRWSVLRFAQERMARGDGTFVFERERLWTNPTRIRAGWKRLCQPR